MHADLELLGDTNPEKNEPKRVTASFSAASPLSSLELAIYTWRGKWESLKTEGQHCSTHCTFAGVIAWNVFSEICDERIFYLEFTQMNNLNHASWMMSPQEYVYLIYIYRQSISIERISVDLQSTEQYMRLKWVRLYERLFQIKLLTTFRFVHHERINTKLPCDWCLNSKTTWFFVDTTHAPSGAMSDRTQAMMKDPLSLLYCKACVQANEYHE